MSQYASGEFSYARNGLRILSFLSIGFAEFDGVLVRYLIC